MRLNVRSHNSRAPFCTFQRPPAAISDFQLFALPGGEIYDYVAFVPGKRATTFHMVVMFVALIKDGSLKANDCAVLKSNRSKYLHLGTDICIA
jgi:hypothetical protein